MNKIQKTLLSRVAAFSKAVAVKASGTVSVCGCHQPKEPTALKTLKK